MIEQTILYRNRANARVGQPEPHARLSAAMVTARAFSLGDRLFSPIDVELMAYVVDIAQDTLQALFLSNSVAAVDIENAHRVLNAAREVASHAPADTEHLDTLIERRDDLDDLLYRVKTGRDD